MKKVKNILLLLTAIFTLGCSQTIVFEDIQTPTPTPTPKPEPEPDLDTSSYIDLSAEGTANCYLVKAAGKYKFKAVKGNSTQSVGAASSATVLWESFGTSSKPNEGDLIASATYKDGYVYFATPNTFKNGNASIAVRDSNAKILWSWHIWLSKEGWKDHVYAHNAGTMMDRNLGATSATPGSVGALGLMYQWGRKDPFLGSSSISSNTLAVSTGSWNSVSTQQTVDYVTANPMTFVCGYSEWCTGDGAEDSNYAKRWTESTKSMYDPCPVGYRVPKGGENGFWATALGTSNSTSAGTTWDSTNKGRHWTLSDGTTAAWYPAVGYRSNDSGSLRSVGEHGYCWSASPNWSNSNAYNLHFYSGNVYPADYHNRSYGNSVRCVSATATSEPTPGITSAPYAVGDYYNDGTKEGVVFEVSADGTSGKIVSMMQATGKLQWSSDTTEQKRLIGADSETDGAANMAVVKAISGWETMYPAFKWCADLGDGWYLPAKEELLTIYNNKDKLNTNLTDKLSSYNHWSSTEDDYQYSDGQFCAWFVDLNDGDTYYDGKLDLFYVRAVATFGNVPKPEPEPDLDYSTATDLSAAGTANCYLVKTTGKYKFKAVKGNSAQSVGTASSATVLWESFGTSTTPNVGDLIASATYKDGYVYFATPNTFKNGNASIAVRDSSGTILWSWHIWCSTEGWKDDIYPNNAGTMMDRNLGATSATPGSVGALGLMYQWGRKDPFLGSSSVSSSILAVSTGTWSSVTTQQTVDYVTANPMIYVCGYSEWCTGDGAEDSNYAKRWTESIKSMYDPCPVGYRVPNGGDNGFWATALGISSATSAGTTWDSTNKGRHWTLSDGTAAWYPAVGCRINDSGALSNVGSYGYYWSASPNPSSSSTYRLYFYNGSVSPASIYGRGNGSSVRCVSTTATSVPTPGITSAPYAVGDYYNDGTKEGVVFEVSADGTSGKIVSMTESRALQWSSDVTEQERLIGADSETDGAANMAVVKAISGWETKYPAFKWCADLGDDWYLPAKEELLTIYNNKDKLNTNLTNKLPSIYYWSSTEYDGQYDGKFCAWFVNMYNGYASSLSKGNLYYVRAVSAF